MKKKNFKKKLSALCLCLLTIVGAAAWLFNTDVATGVNNIKPGQISLVFTDQTTSIELAENNAIPMTTAYAMENTSAYDFTLLNDGDIDLTAKLVAVRDDEEVTDKFASANVMLTFITEPSEPMFYKNKNNGNIIDKESYDGMISSFPEAAASWEGVTDDVYIYAVDDGMMTGYSTSSNAKFYHYVLADGNHICTFNEYAVGDEVTGFGPTSTVASIAETDEEGELVPQEVETTMTLADAEAGIDTVVLKSLETKDYTVYAYISKDAALADYIDNSVAFHFEATAEQLHD